MAPNQATIGEDNSINTGGSTDEISHGYFQCLDPIFINDVNTNISYQKMIVVLLVLPRELLDVGEVWVGGVEGGEGEGTDWSVQGGGRQTVDH